MSDAIGTATLGLDIGGVIIQIVGRGEDTSFDAFDPLSTPAVEGAVQGIRQLVEGRFGERTYLVSKCGPAMEALTLRWLDNIDFFQASGIAPAQVHFCRERREKAGIAAGLGITHFVDDRLDVLRAMSAVDNRFLFNPRPEDLSALNADDSRITVASSWRDLLAGF